MKKILLYTIVSALLSTAWSAPKLTQTKFSGPDLTPSPAVICAATTGEVYVGVDMQGSLGKKAGLGKIVRLIDSNNDGKADKHTVYATVDNPRGLISIGNKLIVLHAVFAADGKIDNQQISVFTDANNDGIADGPAKPLVKNIGNHTPLKSRGVDHSTNGIRLGIDGWVYISIGDFGFQKATGSDGKTLNFQGGGIVRVRPDGSNLESYIHGTRNVYDVAIDPFMNVFTRENTNDGVGWWVRFSHYIQSGEYGYPSLYTNFPEDMIPALNEYGRGSGTGGLYLSEPTWPAAYNNKPLLADWGRSTIYIHGTEAKEASFAATNPEVFLKVSQVTDLDVDASGRMYVASWNGAGYKGKSTKGYVIRVLPEGFQYKPFPNLSKVTVDKLLVHLASKSHTARVDAQQEILRRKAVKLLSGIYELASNNKLSLEARVAAVYTTSQLGGVSSLATLEKLYKLPELREHAVRCMADQKELAVKANVELLVKALSDSNPRVQVAAAVALGRTSKKSSAQSLLKLANRPALDPNLIKKTDKSKSGMYHSTPQYSAILPHIARQALLSLDAQDETIKALQSDSANAQNAALFTMKYMHSTKVLNALINRVKSATDKKFQINIVKTLIRLHQKEKKFDVNYKWWSTRPDPHGPYFYNVDWEGTALINKFLQSYIPTLAAAEKAEIIKEMHRCRSYLAPFAEKPVKQGKKQKTVGKTSVEDLMIFVNRKKGKGYKKPNAAKGKKVISKVGCVACHNIAPGQVVKGPDLSKLGKMSKADIAMSIVRPSATIAKSWVNITTKKGVLHSGTVVKKDKDSITLHNIVGMKTVIKTSDIKKSAPGPELMSLHLCDPITLQEMADLIEYIQSLDPTYKKRKK